MPACGYRNDPDAGKPVALDFHFGEIMIELFKMEAEQTGVRKHGGVLALKQQAGMTDERYLHNFLMGVVKIPLFLAKVG